MALWVQAALLAALAPHVELPAAGLASPRPAACRPLRAEPLAATLWSRARPRELEAMCTLLARGFARLAAHPAEALALAREAQELVPRERAAELLAGRAAFRLGKVREAWATLGPLLEAAPPEDAPSLHDLSRAALSAGALDAAERAYRLLVPRAELLGSSAQRRVVYIEAASLSLARGPEGVDAALGLLAEARAVPLAGDRDLVLGLTALALSRAGRAEQARTVAAETRGPWDLESELSPAERARASAATLGDPSEAEAVPAERGPARVMLHDGELHAVIAVLAEGRDAGMRRAHLQSFLASAAGRGPWADHARRALASRGAR